MASQRSISTTSSGRTISTNTTTTTTNSDRVKVIGYAQRKFFEDGIEYRNFTDDLVGNQQTERNNGSHSNFTIQNFVTTTNFSGKLTRFYGGKKYGEYQTLDSLDLTLDRVNILLNNNINTVINLDNTDLCNFAYFGSAIEFIRVSLENIITNWPASLYVKPTRSYQGNTVVGNTVTDYLYNGDSNVASFKIDTNFINNKFDINYQENGTIVDTFNETNDLRNLKVNNLSYVVFINDIEYPLYAYTGATITTDDYIHIEVLGNPFTGGTDLMMTYHIKPKSELEEQFFNSLNGFEGNLLNRLVKPKFTSEYNYKVESDDGLIINRYSKLTWPTSDGYNIDFNTVEYVDFVSSLVNIGESKDGIETNLIARFLTSESISDFDTIPTCEGEEEETSGQKMNKTLKVYGREFDEIKKYIDGISFANVVTYDKKDNIPDQLIKYLGRTLGWELVSSIADDDLISSYLTPEGATYGGYSRGLTPQEADVEMWRRLILNSAWIWKSKGTRKAVEFFFKFIGAPEGLIHFNEYIYKAKEPIDMVLFEQVLFNNKLDTNLDLYNVDSEGYPKFFRNTSDMYFQKGGQWFRETGGDTSTQHISTGNNPHIGPYDNGREYLDQLGKIIPNFRPFTLTKTIVNRTDEQLFYNYNDGIFNDYGGTFYIDVIDDNGVVFPNITITAEIITDPCPEPEETECGCDVYENDQAIKINFVRGKPSGGSICDGLFDSIVYDDIDNLWIFKYKLYRLNKTVDTSTKDTIFAPKECCESIGGNPFFYEEFKLLNPYNPNQKTGSTTTSPTIGKSVAQIPVPVPTDVAIFDKKAPLNDGNICCKSEGVANDWGVEGCGCVLSCQWQLVSRSMADMYTPSRSDPTTYLKFLDPRGNYRVVNEADSCFCVPGLTQSRIITDPYTGKVGYACAISSTINQRSLIDVPPTNTDMDTLYNTYYQRAIRQIDCDDTIAILTK